MGEGRTDRPAKPATNQHLTVSEAAERLGISEDAVRSRIKRGTLRSERRGGRVYVALVGRDQPRDRPDESTALTSELRERVRFLEDELRRKDAILLNMTEAMKALSPPREEAPESADEDEPHSATGEAQGGVQRPWWRRWFGG